MLGRFRVGSSSTTSTAAAPRTGVGAFISSVAKLARSVQRGLGHVTVQVGDLIETASRGGGHNSDDELASQQSLQGLMMDTEDDDDVEEEGTEDDFRERVAWQSKYDAKTCFGCGSSFNPITNRHHHCRACGRVVCGACSDHKDRVRGYSKPQRTCNECHESIQSEVTASKLLMAFCPCLKQVKKEIKRHAQAQVLYDGAVFVKQRDLKSMSTKLVSGLLGSMKKGASSNDAASGDGGASFGDAGSALSNPDSPSLSRQRVRVRLRNDGLVLSVAPVAGDADDEEVYLHDVKAVEQRGRAGLAIIGKKDENLFVGDLADKKKRDEWVRALTDAVKVAQQKPMPPRTSTMGARSGSHVLSTAHKAKREIELQSKKRDAEKKKTAYMKSVGGGLKYTAVAMADRMAARGGSSGGSSSSAGLA